MRKISIVEKKIIINHIYKHIASAIEETVQNEKLSLEVKNELYEKCFEQLIVKRTEYEEMVRRIREQYSEYEYEYEYEKEYLLSLFIPWSVERMWEAVLINKELFMNIDQVFEGKIVIVTSLGCTSRIQICDGKIEKIYYQGPKNEQLQFWECVKEYAKEKGFKVEVNNEIWGRK